MRAEDWVRFAVWAFILALAPPAAVGLILATWCALFQMLGMDVGICHWNQG